MDDVNMSYLICEEDIANEFKTFNIKTDDKDVLTKLKNICMVYDFTAEQLTNRWIAFCSKKAWENDLDLTKIELFENESFKKEKLKLDNASNDNKFRKAEQEETFIQVDDDILNDYGDMVVENVNSQSNAKVNGNQNKTNGDHQQNGHQNDKQQNGQQQNGHQNGNQSTDNQTNKQTENSSTTKLDSQQQADSCVLENKLNESVELGYDNQIVNTFGDTLTPNEWINEDKTKYSILPLNPELHITKAFKNSQIKIGETNNILNELIDEMFDLVKSKLNPESNDELGEQTFVGSIHIDVQPQTKEKTIYFENFKLFQHKFKLDLSKIDDYSLFPGKIVCFEGELQDECLVVHKFYDNQHLIPSFYQKPIKLISNSLDLMVASGPISPFDSDDLSSLETLLEQVKLIQPHFLILLGPFFDCRNDYLLFNCDGENFFNKIMRLISLSLENIVTQAIIVPSTFDLNNYNIFPAPPFEQTYPKIKFMPNPSFLNLNGIVLSICSVDIIRHIMRDEIKKNGEDDQERICEHLLTQRNLYPLAPPNQEINLEYSKLDFIKFNVRPQLFIIPSMIKNFIKNVHGSLFLNPEFLSKGVFAKVKISCPSKDHIGSIDQFTKIEIVKNKQTKKN